eukprot:2003584-Alexandrium_andersonii.AAC.1
MSASLVGSEMCIRDSADAQSGEDRHDTPNRANMQHASIISARHAQLCAVSYTHLTLPTICSV